MNFSSCIRASLKNQYSYIALVRFLYAIKVISSFRCYVFHGLSCLSLISEEFIPCDIAPLTKKYNHWQLGLITVPAQFPVWEINQHSLEQRRLDSGKRAGKIAPTASLNNFTQCISEKETVCFYPEGVQNYF